MLTGNDVYIAYVGDASTTAFNYPNSFIDQQDLLVTVAPAGSQNHPVSQTLGTDYTIADAPIDGWRPNGGVINMIVPPGVNTTVLITRRTPVDQTHIYAENDPFPAKSHERALDKLTMIAQERCGARGCQGFADGPPSGGTRSGGGLYQEGDHFDSRHVDLGGIRQWILVRTTTPGQLVWAQSGNVSLMSGVD